MLKRDYKNIDNLIFKWLWTVIGKQIEASAPHCVKIETTNYCNGACKYCLYQNLKREKGNELEFIR
ncbi:MAG: hypothetical protein NC925_03250, partial [Candidatus Omnitrophica bacterium]|nr:hypothetical protein [Candidatus Omnitrophota bacterium]